ncbi:DUF4296 domain-containing protein [Flavobacterium sp. XN-5]|uniref:DUF4296 domain-containing protein n=1 Tax=Flavobacterium sp. XN-5 TaxID=2599390 RepID=UPI0011C90F3F|nr:DUF4296 domain-containing protein [Flavobacterium sp. XN-5]NGY36395.1 DUF4296 domain-containing protein [Flavobacterium sp. XN-5]
MKKLMLLLTVLVGFMSCKEEVVHKPDNLIERDMMIDVMYDLSIFDAIKYQNPASIDTFKINPSQYIFKKYKIDSLQFAQSNTYYASNYIDYKEMYDELIQRIEAKKTVLDSLVKREEKKQEKLKADSLKKVKSNDVKKDSLLLKKKKTILKNGKDSLRIQ